MKQPTKPLKDREIITQADWSKLVQSYWLPVLGEMLVADAVLALKPDRTGAEARERIYNRLIGKPIEQVRQESSQTITITVHPIATVDTPLPQGDEGGVCEQAMDRSSSYLKAPPSPPEHSPHPPTLLSRGTLNEKVVTTPQFEKTPPGSTSPDEVPPREVGIAHPMATPVAPQVETVAVVPSISSPGSGQHPSPYPSTTQHTDHQPSDTTVPTLLSVDRRVARGFAPFEPSVSDDAIRPKPTEPKPPQTAKATRTFRKPPRTKSH